MQTEKAKPRGPDRRNEDRRKAQLQPLPFPDRRSSERRNGADRRAAPPG